MTGASKNYYTSIMSWSYRANMFFPPTRIPASVTNVVYHHSHSFAVAKMKLILCRAAQWLPVIFRVTDCKGIRVTDCKLPEFSWPELKFLLNWIFYSWIFYFESTNSLRSWVSTEDSIKCTVKGLIHWCNKLPPAGSHLFLPKCQEKCYVTAVALPVFKRFALYSACGCAGLEGDQKQTILVPFFCPVGPQQCCPVCWSGSGHLYLVYCCWT